MFAKPDINTRGVGRITVSYVREFSLLICTMSRILEFSQPLSCLYQAMRANTGKTFSIAFIAWLARQKLNILMSQPYIPSCKHASRSMRARVLSIVSCFIKFNLSIIEKFLLATSSGGNNFLNRNSNKQETVCKKMSFFTVLGRTYTSSESITLSLFRSHCSKEVWESSSSMEWW